MTETGMGEYRRGADGTEERASVKRRRLAWGATIVLLTYCLYLVTSLVIVPGTKKRAFIERYGQEVYDRYGLVERDGTFVFGSYEQDNDLSNGKEKIEWIVLEVDGNKALLLSKHALNCQPYNLNREAVSWSDCFLREWLNGDFFSAAFSPDEQKQIPLTEVGVDKVLGGRIYPSGTVWDRVFLLSRTEAERYLVSRNVRHCEGTTYCEAQGAFMPGGKCDWWLRTASFWYDRALASIVLSDTARIATSDVIIDHYGVRPVIWIDFASGGGPDVS